jgi:hypothetical protein
MPDPELVQVLDYILNRSDEASLEALIAGIVRRRRDLTAFNSITGFPDPQRMAKEITEELTAGIGGGIESLKDSVREMAVRIIKEHAPELTEKQIDELCREWLPDNTKNKSSYSPDLLKLMVEQFVSFSQGKMNKLEDKNLRQEMGAWPERYWKAFPPVIRQIITDFLKDRITQEKFNSGIEIALADSL